jgi:DNA-binding SARP family transcriptional activator
MDFRILGPVEVADGDSLVGLTGAKQRALLAALLLQANEVVSADRLIEDLWGEQSPDSGRTALQVRISQLRKALGRAGAVLITRPPGYILQLEPQQLDLHRFERLVEEADAAPPTVAAEKLREALALWRGPPLADLTYESFAQAAIARLEELRLAALEKRIEADLARGRHADVVAELEAFATEHPLRERVRAQLMLALYRCGRQADALTVYQSGRRTLIQELGIEPSPPLRELEQAILRQDPSLELAGAPLPERSLLVVPLAEARMTALLGLAAPLARRPTKELVLSRLIEDRLDLSAATAVVNEQRARLLADGIATRAVAFVSSDRGHDAVRVAAELGCDLLLVDAPAKLLDSPVLQAILTGAPATSPR